MRGLQAARGAPLTSPQETAASSGAASTAGQHGPAAGQQEQHGQCGPAAGQERPAAGQPRRPRRVLLLVTIALAVLALDIVSKLLVVAHLEGRPPVRLLGGFLHLLVSRNPGAAFSIGTSMTVIFSLIAVTVIVVILRTSQRIRSIGWAVTLGLLLGGATGNLTDRIFRSPGLFRGWVVDWIQLPHWPVFNLADSAIVCGGALAVLLSARNIRLDGQRGDAEESQDTTE